MAVLAHNFPPINTYPSRAFAPPTLFFSSFFFSLSNVQQSSPVLLVSQLVSAGRAKYKGL